MGLLFAWTGCIVRFCRQSFTNYGEQNSQSKENSNEYY